MSKVSTSEALQVSVISQGLHTDRPRHIFLTDTGNGQGALSYTGDYSVTAKDIYFEALTKFEIYTLMFNVSDNSKFLQVGYGGMAALTNGLKFFFKPNGQAEIPLFGGYAVKSNLGMVNLTQDTTLTQFDGTNETLAATIDSVQHYGMPLYMNTCDRFIIRLNDDFTALVAQSFIIGGKEVN